MRARRQRALFIELLALETRRGQIQAELRGIYEADQTDHRNPPLSRDDGYWGKVPAPAPLLEFDTGPRRGQEPLAERALPASYRLGRGDGSGRRTGQGRGSSSSQTVSTHRSPSSAGKTRSCCLTEQCF